MPWPLASAGHQQPWYWLFKINRKLSLTRGGISITRAFQQWEIIENTNIHVYVNVAWMNLPPQWFTVVGVKYPQEQTTIYAAGSSLGQTMCMSETFLMISWLWSILRSSSASIMIRCTHYIPRSLSSEWFTKDTHSPLGRGMGVLREIEAWAKFYLRSWLKFEQSLPLKLVRFNQYLGISY